ncbi:hypothetical protein TNIN_433221, partial [Trichonephila inaurata madagascariensis]
MLMGFTNAALLNVRLRLGQHRTVEETRIHLAHHSRLRYYAVRQLLPLRQ